MPDYTYNLIIYLTLVLTGARAESLNPKSYSNLDMADIRDTNVFFSFYLRQQVLLHSPVVGTPSGLFLECRRVMKGELG
jgi:hypothetical protein